VVTAPLHVDPEHLRSAAAAQSAVASYVSGLATGQSMSAAVQSMPGLAVHEACCATGALLDALANDIGTDVARHAELMTVAAAHYQRMDSELGRRLRRFVE
jgi:hypothetical protein